MTTTQLNAANSNLAVTDAESLKNKGLFYIKPDSLMTSDMEQALNATTYWKVSDVLEQLNKEVLGDLKYCSLHLGITTHKPVGDAKVQLENIKQVFLFDYANVVQSQSDDMKGVDRAKLNKVVHNLIHSSTDHGWNIEVLTVRRGVTSRSIVKRNGTHPLEAVESGLMFLADYANNDFYGVLDGGDNYDNRKQWVKDAVRKCASAAEPIVLEIGLGDDVDRITHTVVTVEPRNFVSYEEENNLI